jgi:hypothetical protein
MGKKIIVRDKFQDNYSYELSEPEGKNFNKEFTPDLTPHQMLELGVFGGEYFADKPNDIPGNWCLTTLAGVARKRLDRRARSTRLVSVVLPVLSRASNS